MNVKELLSQQPITQTGLMPSSDLVEIIQRLVRTVQQQQADITALQASMAEISTINDIDGGNP